MQFDLTEFIVWNISGRRHHGWKNLSLNLEYLLLRGNVWSESVEHCISIDFLLQYGGEDVKNALTFTHSHLTQPDIER